VDLPDHQARAKALGVDEAVKFLGRVPNAAVQALYHRAAVFVMPSLWKEQFGIVGIEALACGTPCAASRLGGIPEWLLDGKHGYLFDPHDPEDIAEKVLRILDDPERAKAFGRNGRAFIEEHYAIDVHRRHLTEIIDDMLVDAVRAG
jgi:glycosyltransferase involved in cell wall biosynthesis